MPERPAEARPRIAPYLLYADVEYALEWLARAFGFRERLRFADDEGTVVHAEMELDGGLLMLGHPGPEYQNPKRLRAVTQMTHVYVDDVAAHYERAARSGATILSEPSEQPYGDLRYDAMDVEGHCWSFAQRLRELAPEEWGAVTPDP
jgi:uncharacterized glyoxalase superfamily protein PhnB